MRTDTNPAKHADSLDCYLSNRIILPVYVPNLDGYFKNSEEVLELCLKSIHLTIHEKASVTVIANGCIPAIEELLIKFQRTGWIDQLIINVVNRGKVDSILAAARSSFESVITIVDSDVYFKQGWLEAIEQIFSTFPECGVVSPFPNPAHVLYHTSATILGSLLTCPIKIGRLIPEQDLIEHMKGIGNPSFFKEYHLKRHLYVQRGNQTALVGAGHFVLSLRREILKDFPVNPTNMALASIADENWIDVPPDKAGWWRLSTPRSYVYHMGNTPEIIKGNNSDILKSKFSQPLPPLRKNTISAIPYPIRQIVFRGIAKLLKSKLREK